MATSHLNIDSVPNEILLAVLDDFATRDLLPLAAVSRRFLAAVLRILDCRMARASSLPDKKLILECYHPSAKISTPYLFCDYLSTGPLETGPEAGDEADQEPSFAGLNGLYSRFRPVVQEENRRARLRYPTQMLQAAQDGASSSQPTPEPELASHDIFLDDGELFSQLCTVANLVKVGPKRGLFLSHVNISEGVVRVWRNWLAERAAQCSAEGRREEPRPKAGDNLILWTNSRTCNVGLRLRVVERDVAPSHGAPILVGADEDVPVAYRLQYEELLVRTNQLLLMVEKSEAQEVATSGFYFEGTGGLPCAVQPIFTWADLNPDARKSYLAPATMVA